MANLKLALVLLILSSCLMLVAMATDDGDASSVVPARRSVNDCRVDPSRLIVCKWAVTGKYPPPPTAECCRLIRRANLPCLCQFKSFLPAFGIDPARAMALPKKCGLKPPPPC
ncbi:Putative lipid-transfer protein DIR1 [Linum grandiflorum]